eukprot:scaffold106174_cov66-Phaeocystis_antarctica.AAC.1
MSPDGESALPCPAEVELRDAPGVRVARPPAGARSARGRRRIRLPRRACHAQRLPATARRRATEGPPVVPLLAPAAHPRAGGALQAALFARVAPRPPRPLRRLP